MRRFKAWFIELSRVGKLSALAVVALSSIFTVSAMSQSPDTETLKPKSVQQAIKHVPVITTSIESETKPIVFSEETIDDANLAKGTTVMRTVGVDGIKTVTHTITLSDGVEISRATSEAVTVEPVTQVTAVGTYVAPTPTPKVSPDRSTEGVIKMSRTGICHAPGTTYYARTQHYTGYGSLDVCLGAGGRMPKR